jgi:hypothetical protein
VILAYAQQWGVLEICEHEMPHTHSRACLPRGRDVPGRAGWEPVMTWRHFSRQFRDLLIKTAHLYRQSPKQASEKEARVQQWIPIMNQLNEWVRISGVHLALDIKADDALTNSYRWPLQGRLVFDGGGLFGLLAAQLLMATTRSEDLLTCSACGAPFLPARRGRQAERHYCVPCRASNAAQREWWRGHRCAR